jgi:nucleotide-binding universal stress UspA family protein
MSQHPIIVPMDGSNLAEAALPYAAALARVEEQDIQLLAVAEQLNGVRHAERLQSLVADALQSRLTSLAARLQTTGLRIEVSVRRGDPVEIIVATAATHRARMVVMTSHGMGGQDHWLMGSVADKVLRLASCPVLLVRPNAVDVDPTITWRPRRLIVPLDGSAVAEQALPFAYRWAAGFGAEVLLVRVQPWLAMQFAFAGGYLRDLAEWDTELVAAASSYLQGLRQAPPSGVTVQTNVLRGNPTSCLCDFANQDDLDLFVMTSYGKSGLGGAVLGSVADRLVRERRLVCIVHPVPAGASPASSPSSDTAPSALSAT